MKMIMMNRNTIKFVIVKYFLKSKLSKKIFRKWMWIVVVGDILNNL